MTEGNISFSLPAEVYNEKLKINDASLEKSIRKKDQNSQAFVNSARLCTDQMAVDRES